MKHFENINGYIKTLEGGEVGDEFYTHKRYSSNKVIVKCERVTPKQAVIGGDRYRISDALGLGSSRFDRVPSLWLLTPDILTEIKERNETLKLLQDFKNFKFDKLDLKRLREVHAFLYGEQNDNT